MSHASLYTILGRKPIIINTDPQRRCYYGTLLSYEKAWAAWAELGWVRTLQEAQASVASWRKHCPSSDFMFQAPTGVAS